MGKKVIRISLSEKDIDRAIKELEQYKREIIRKTELLRTRIAERIANLAQSGFNGAVVDDLTGGSGGARKADVRVSIDERENVSVIIAAGEDAVWVEFGAGVFHNGSTGGSPHPKGSELGFTIGGYGKGILERDIDHAPAVFFTPLTECEVHAAVYLLINFPQLYQVEAIIQSVDKTSCIELVVVV